MLESAPQRRPAMGVKRSPIERLGYYLLGLLPNYWHLVRPRWLGTV
jgi:hypothetical protein